MHLPVSTFSLGDGGGGGGTGNAEANASKDANGVYVPLQAQAGKRCLYKQAHLKDANLFLNFI